MIVLVMGVSGSGKTTVAKLLADRLGWQFQEGDDLHPAANVAKMHAGTPLTDADRMPWLYNIAGVLGGWQANHESGVLTCSALKRSYRDILVDGAHDVRLVYLRGSKELIQGRLARRRGHFMPASLLDSQFADLEEPTSDEHAITVDIGAGTAEIVTEIVTALPPD